MKSVLEQIRTSRILLRCLLWQTWDGRQLKFPNRLTRESVCVILLLIAFTFTAVRSEDWPTYMHDIARSGVTSEQLTFPISEEWVFKSKHPPEPAWPGPKPTAIGGILETHRMHFDDALHIAAVGDSVYFGSSVDNKVYCLDASTGHVRWTYFTEGPIRLAPTVWQDKVFVGSDDGFVYCFDVANGRLIWKFRAALNEKRVLGNGRIISFWPVRTGVLVDNGVAYFGAGVFPAEGVYLYAVSAEDGKLVWRNDTWGSSLSDWISRSPQGYALASEDKLFVPCGRALPAAFHRNSGRFLYQRNFGWDPQTAIGGTYALIAGDHLYSGTDLITAYDGKAGDIGFAWFPGRRLIVTMDTSYMLTDGEMLALDRTTYYDRSRKSRDEKRKQRSLANRRSKLNGDVDSVRSRISEIQGQIAELNKQSEGKEGTAELTVLRNDLKVLSDKLKAAEKELEAVIRQLAEIGEQLAEEGQLALARDEEPKKTEEEGFKWRHPSQCSDSMILAGGIVFAGGQDKVIAVDKTTGKELWSYEVDGTANGLAAANGRLFVSTDRGTIHCFGEGESSPPEHASGPVNAVPHSVDELNHIYEAAAERIVSQTGIKRGYCLVLGCRTGRLALELSKCTNLMIYGIEPDRKKVEAVRNALDKTGIYGVRVSVDNGSLVDLPYPDYFANLIVSEEMLLSGRMRTPAKEMLRVLKPCGGVVYLGQPTETMGLLKRRLNAKKLRRWLTEAGIDEFQVMEDDGVWVKAERGPLPEAGSWTHQYANPGNTACSDDQLVRCPLGVLWFGEPGPAKVVNRHAKAAGPLSINGRLFVEGHNVVMAYDAYNGLQLWEREIEGAIRVDMEHQCSNIACDDDSLFVAVGEECLRLDAATGKTRNTYSLPPSPDGKPRSWGYVAVVGNSLFGSSARPKRATSDLLLAVDLESDKHRWIHHGKSVAHNTIAMGHGRIFFADSGVTGEQRQETLKEKMGRIKGLKGLEALETEKKLDNADVRLVVALDAGSGQVVWQRPIDLTDCGGSKLHAIYNDSILLFCGAFSNGHYGREFQAGKLAHRRITALSASDGKLLWSRALGYITRPLVNGNVIYADPWAFDLRTGEQITRIHPVTGESVPFQFGRAHHCGPVSGSPNCLFMRSLTSAYYDLTRDSGVLHFGGHRPGCWINMIAANGLILEPEASSGCQCPFSLYSTVVFKPRDIDRAWGIYCSQDPVTPVENIAINLGAPGDRRGDDGTLWLAYPRPSLGYGLWPVLKFDLKTSILPGLGYFMLNPEGVKIDGTDKPWLFSSGCYGLSRVVIPLMAEGQEPATYTVRLYFVELTNDRRGQRVFDVRIQDEVVLEDFDILKAAGTPTRGIVEEFSGIRVTGMLSLELIPRLKKPSFDRVPIVSAIEVFRER